MIARSRAGVGRRWAHSLLLAAGALACAGCIPLPHRAFRTPLVVGTVEDGGKPLSRATVKVVADPTASCSGSHVIEATTDADGKFVVCPIPDFQLTLKVMAHRRFHWQVCVAAGGAPRPLDSGEMYTLVDSGPSLVSYLECDLTRTDAPCTEREEAFPEPAVVREALAGKRCKGLS